MYTLLCHITSKNIAMKILVLGGCGIQGRAAIYDLVQRRRIEEVICADIKFDGLEKIKNFAGMEKVRPVAINASDLEGLIALFRQCDIVIDLLPRAFKNVVCKAAFKSRTSVVNTNYAGPLIALDQKAKKAGVAIMTECGLDPGIDLVIYKEAINRFDEIHLINSYCGGFPEKTACNNPLNYKASWTWEGVLSSTLRDARIIKDGNVMSIPAKQQHAPDNVHFIDFPGLGKLEAIPNGDAVYFTDLLGVTNTIRETGRYSLRWPGWSNFWHTMKQLGFLSQKPVSGLPGDISPYRFLEKFLGPKLEYKDDEKDLVAMVNIFEGISNNRKIRFTSRILIERDLDTGLMAMSKGVGYTASIVALMLADGIIDKHGILTPALHVSSKAFFSELTQRGIIVKEEEAILE